MLNFLANTLDQKIEVDLNKNPEIESEGIWDVLVHWVCTDPALVR